MTIQAKLVRGLSQLRVVACAVRIVAAKACNAAPVHHALYKIIPLHAVLVRGGFREVRERGLAQRVLLQLPKILQA